MRRSLTGIRRTAAIAVSLSLLAAPAVAATGWTTPDNFFVPGSYISYSGAFDEHGAIHAAAEPGFDQPGLYYVTQHTSERVVGGTRSSFESSIALRGGSASGPVRIAWIDTQHRSAIWITRNDTGHWVSSRLWLGAAHHVSIADRGAGIAVAFEDGHHRLRYLTWDPVHGPTSAAVVSTDCCKGAPALVQHGGTSWIAFSEHGPSHRARLAERHGDGHWSVSVVDAHATASPSLAFTGSVPVVAYVIPGSGVWWARRTVSGWQTRQGFGVAYAGADVATDAHGRIAVVAVAGPRLAYRRLDTGSPSVIVAHMPGLRLFEPMVALAHGHAAVTFSTFCGCAGDGGGLWITKQL